MSLLRCGFNLLHNPRTGVQAYSFKVTGTAALPFPKERQPLNQHAAFESFGKALQEKASLPPVPWTEGTQRQFLFSLKTKGDTEWVSFFLMYLGDSIRSGTIMFFFQLKAELL